MRNFIVVSAVALVAALSFGASASAETIRVVTHDMHHPQHCVVKVEKHRDHRGHVVVSKTRVCH
jgi:hypothetical protein